MMANDSLSRARAGCRLARSVLLFLAASQLAAGCVSTQHAEPEPVAFASPALSPDGRLVALQAWIRGHPGLKLVVFDVETRSLSTFDPPPDQTWRRPVFSPSGDRLAFLRNCRNGCASGPKGFHVGTLDLKTGRDAVVTATPLLAKEDPIFAPGGRFIVYAALSVADADRRPASKSPFNTRHSFWTKNIHTLDLKTGHEEKLPFPDDWQAPFVKIRAAGFLDEKTLVIRSMGFSGDGTHLEQLKQRMQNAPDMIKFPETGEYLYSAEFDGSFVTASEVPSVDELGVLKSDWIRPVSHGHMVPGAMVSSDAGLIAFAGRSEQGKGRCVGRCAGDYDVFIGNEETVRQATFLHTHMSGVTIFQSGNRVAFLGYDDNRDWQLWMHDVASGRTWKTDLRQKLAALSLGTSSAQNASSSVEGLDAMNKERKTMTSFEKLSRKHDFDYDRSESLLQRDLKRN